MSIFDDIKVKEKEYTVGVKLNETARAMLEAYRQYGSEIKGVELSTQAILETIIKKHLETELRSKKNNFSFDPSKVDKLLAQLTPSKRKGVGHEVLSSVN